MDQWKRKVGAALDALLAAHLEELSVRRELEARIGAEKPVPVALKRRWLAKHVAVGAARHAVDAALWESDLTS